MYQQIKLLLPQQRGHEELKADVHVKTNMQPTSKHSKQPASSRFVSDTQTLVNMAWKGRNPGCCSAMCWCNVARLAPANSMWQFM
jgi:hypothetical protein